MTVDEIRAAALKLDREDRALLARNLLASLEESPDEELERLWLREATRRLSEIREGKVPAIRGEEAFRKVRDALG